LTDRASPALAPIGWLALAALGLGVLGMSALWLAISWTLGSPCVWLAPVAALDMALMLRMGGAPAGRRRASLAVAGTLATVAISAWMIAATQMGRLLGLSPLESAQRLGPVLAGELTRHATSPWDLAWLGLAVALAWRLGR
jgi:hypothetical protein